MLLQKILIITNVNSFELGELYPISVKIININVFKTRFFYRFLVTVLSKIQRLLSLDGSSEVRRKFMDWLLCVRNVFQSLLCHRIIMLILAESFFVFKWIDSVILFQSHLVCCPSKYSCKVGASVTNFDSLSDFYYILDF
jgi:hypothetical protein